MTQPDRVVATMLDGGGYSVGGSGFYRRALKLRTGSISTPSGKGSASEGMWKVGVSLLSTDGVRATTNGSPSLTPS
jgi:hypothetical protein